MEPTTWMPALIGALLGASLGSFALVTVVRLRRGESVAAPRSHCDACSHAISPLDNVPIVSWLVLRGRCRTCRAPIPGATIAFELAGAALGLALAVALASAAR